MSDDGKTLWIGNLDEKVTEELLYELFLQAGPIERLVLPAEGEGDNKKNKGHAYVVFHHTESVQYATQVMEGSSLFGHQLTMKARALPLTYKTVTSASGRGRFDNSAYKPGFNKANTWHGQNDFSTRGRGSFRGRGGSSNYTQNSGFNTGFNNYNNQQTNSGFWMGGQQTTSDSQASSFSTTDNSLEDKRQRLLQQQNLTLEAHRQIQHGVMNMASQVYGMVQQQSQTQPPPQQGWSNNGYNNTNTSTSWNMGGGGDTTGYQGYPADQYGNWYQQQ